MPAGDDEAYRPHISLAYGEPPAARRAVLLDGARHEGLAEGSFTATELVLARSSSSLPVEAWAELERAPLRRPREGATPP